MGSILCQLADLFLFTIMGKTKKLASCFGDDPSMLSLMYLCQPNVVFRGRWCCKSCGELGIGDDPSMISLMYLCQPNVVFRGRWCCKSCGELGMGGSPCLVSPPW